MNGLVYIAVYAVDLSLHAERKSVFYSHTPTVGMTIPSISILYCYGVVYETVVIAYGVVGSCENKLILHGGVS